MINKLLVPASGAILFEITGYSSEMPKCVSDANWLKTTISINSTSISAKVEAFVSTMDLHNFLSELNKIISARNGEAVLSTDEEAVFLKVCFNNNEKHMIEGYLKEIEDISINVFFQLSIDHQDLINTINNLTSLLEYYPVITD